MKTDSKSANIPKNGQSCFCTVCEPLLRVWVKKWKSITLLYVRRLSKKKFSLCDFLPLKLSTVWDRYHAAMSCPKNDLFFPYLYTRRSKINNSEKNNSSHDSGLVTKKGCFWSIFTLSLNFGVVYG